MAGGAIVQLWNEWATQILILLSFAMQIFLFLFAGKRRRGSSDVLRILLWLGYLMADSIAVYTLGHLSISGALHEHKMLVFWAPFLLVHLGSQDTITAYSLEDNQLWPRHLLNLGVQALGVAYVLYKHIADIPVSLRLATCLMFIIGVIKYGERIWALKGATLDNVQAGVHYQILPNYYHALPPRGPGAEEHDEEDLLLFAQAVLPLCKGAMTDSPLLLGYTTIPTSYACDIWDKWNWKAMCKLVEMELSLMYDILYTKSTVIHTWCGYCIRFFSPLATMVVFVLFQLNANKDSYNRVDVVITYILLVGALLIDMVSLFMAVMSTWTCHLLLAKKWTRLGRVILSLRRHIKEAAGVNRGWSGYIGQFNLLHFCSRDREKLHMVLFKGIQVAKRMGLLDWWNKWYYSKAVVLSVDVKELLLKCVWKVLMDIHDPSAAKDEIMSLPNEMILEEPIAMMPDQNLNLHCNPELYTDTARRRMKLAQALDLGAELQEAILNWHICTDVILLCDDTSKDRASSTYIEVIKAVSNYMVFLITVCPGTIPGLELRGMYEATRKGLEYIWLELLEDSAHLRSATREKTLASYLLQTSTRELNISISHGTLYAKLLLELVGSNPDKSCSGIISSYTDRNPVAMDRLKRLMPHLELSCGDGVFNMSKALPLILDTWVRLLILASSRCRKDVHARHINCGGDLSTVVWLMEDHASMFFHRRPGVAREHQPIIFSGRGRAAV